MKNNIENSLKFRPENSGLTKEKKSNTFRINNIYDDKFYARAFYMENAEPVDDGIALSSIEIERLEKASFIKNIMHNGRSLSYNFQILFLGSISFFVWEDAQDVYKCVAHAYEESGGLAPGLRLSTFRYFDDALCSEKPIFFLFARADE